MKHIILFILLLLLAGYTQAQRENIWMLGNGGLDFNNRQAAPVTFPAGTPSFNEAGASVCDKKGQLLFYTDGTIVWTRNFNVMPGGGDLTGLGSAVTASCTQGTMIVPVPEQDNQYYVFSLTSVELGVNAGRLYYSVVDMTLNNGLGDILPGQKGLLLDSDLTEKLTGVAGDQCNVWVISRSKTSGTFKSYEVTATGINATPVLSNTGLFNYNLYLLGELKPSPDRKKIVSCNAPLGGGGLELFDFNPATGVLSNPLILDNSVIYYSAAFSPDNSKIYGMIHFNGSGRDPLFYQFDLSAAKPSDTKLQLGATRPFCKIKLAANGKVYCASNAQGSNIISTINNPNAAGLACNYVNNAISFSGSFLTFPNIVPEVLRDTAAYTRQSLTAPCWQSNLVLNGNISGWDYHWDDNSTDQHRTVKQPGTYWVSYHTPPCVYHIDTFIVGFPNGQLPKISISPSCSNDFNGKASAATYTGDTVSYAYVWRDKANRVVSGTDTAGNLPSGNYNLQITTAQCDTIISVYIPEEQHKAAFTADSLICTHELLNFNNTSNSNFTRFHWDFNDGQTSEQTQPDHSFLAPGTYTVRMMAYGAICKDTASQTILVDAPDKPVLIKDLSSICAGESISLTLKTDNTHTGTLWELGDGTTLEVADNVLQHAYDKDGIMPLLVTTHFRACPDILLKDTLQVYPIPIVNLGADTTLCPGSAPLRLQNKQPVPDNYQYLWSTGDTTPTLSITHQGQFQLQVTAVGGCIATDEIIVSKDCYMDIPNAFTPNGDGDNDYFFPRQLLTKGLTKFSMKIFSRWGALLFETHSTSGRGWDGKFNEKMQNAGVYIYNIEVEIGGSSIQKYQGNVTLLP